MRLLVVEDEAKTADFLAKGLKESGFAVDVALNGLDGRYFVEQQEYDLIILDVMLPGLNGWQLLQLIRQRGATPVLFLTARDAIEDRVRGLELGADDYLLKTPQQRLIVTKCEFRGQRAIQKHSDHTQHQCAGQGNRQRQTPGDGFTHRALPADTRPRARCG